jgi:hypothetical protein
MNAEWDGVGDPPKGAHMMDTVIELHARHVEACIQRDRCARRALELFDECKDLEAWDALHDAELWDLRAKALEPGSGVERIGGGEHGRA